MCKRNLTLALLLTLERFLCKSCTYEQLFLRPFIFKSKIISMGNACLQRLMSTLKLKDRIAYCNTIFYLMCTRKLA